MGITPWRQQSELPVTLASWKNVPKKYNADGKEHGREQKGPRAEISKNEEVEGRSRYPKMRRLREAQREFPGTGRVEQVLREQGRQDKT